MNAPRQIELPERFRVVLTLAQLLERLENSAAPVSADQYRSVVRHLADELANLDPGLELDAVLKSFPAATQLYENQRYEQAGLCRAPLELSLNTEQQARSALARIAAL
jgi:exonuclease VII small subunit